MILKRIYFPGTILFTLLVRKYTNQMPQHESYAKNTRSTVQYTAMAAMAIDKGITIALR